jgi:hypothetical protein
MRHWGYFKLIINNTIKHFMHWMSTVIPDVSWEAYYTAMSLSGIGYEKNNLCAWHSHWIKEISIGVNVWD